MSFNQGIDHTAGRGSHGPSEARRLNRSQPWVLAGQLLNDSFSSQATTSRSAIGNNSSFNTTIQTPITSFGTDPGADLPRDGNKSFLSSSDEDDGKGYDEAWLKTNLAKAYEGAAKFAGISHCFTMPTETQYRYFASAVEHRPPRVLSLPSMSFSFLANEGGHSALPWQTLEQPSVPTYWGERAGTITLDHWLQISGSFHPTQEPVYSGIVQRDIDANEVFERLIDLQERVETDDLTRHMYTYGNLIQCWEDPQYIDITQEVRDLAHCLAGHDFWILSLPKHQVIGTLINGRLSRIVTLRFMHQIMLAIEIHHRLRFLDYDTKIHLLSELPPKVAWDLVASKTWMENITVYRAKDNHYGLNFLSLPKQISTLKDFARKVKWPTTADADRTLDHLEERPDLWEDPHFFSWISGVVLPGPSTCWLLMNSLLCLDPEVIHVLDDLDSKHINTGFQYRTSTYWYRECIMGKVLAAAKGVVEVAGWICACPPSLELSKFQLVHIVQKEVEHHMAPRDVERMDKRTRALGPYSLQSCHPSFFTIPAVGRHFPSSSEAIRIQKLEFLPAFPKYDDASLFLSALTFSLGPRTVSLSLRYNVSFLAAVHCHKGPHLLCTRRYKYETVAIARLPELAAWAHADADEPFEYQPVEGIARYDPGVGGGVSSSARGEPREVLVVEAFGSRDAEVMARAWCAHLGLSAIVADVGTTCTACGIRGAYAACVAVVILTRKADLVEEE